MAVEQAVDEMEVAGAAASGADGDTSREVRFGSRREGGDLFVADVNPLDLALTADGIRQAVEAVAYDAVNPCDACRRQDIGELVRNHHDLDPSQRRQGVVAPEKA